MTLSPTSWPGGGSSAVITREQLGGDPVTVGNGNTGNLTWDSSFGPATLLDRSNVALPTVLEAGVYAVSAWIATDGLTANGWYQAQLKMDSTGENARVGAESAPSIAAHLTPSTFISNVYYIPAGGTIRLTLTNHDGAAPAVFTLFDGIVQRLS